MSFIDSQHKKLFESWKRLTEVNKIIPTKQVNDYTYDFSIKGVDFRLFFDEYDNKPNEITYEFYFAVKDPSVEGGLNYDIILNKVDPTDIMATIVDIQTKKIKNLPQNIQTVKIELSPMKMKGEEKLKPSETKRGRFYLKYLQKYLSKNLEPEWTLDEIKHFTNGYSLIYLKNN